MARPKAVQLTPVELDIMNILWRLGQANVQTVQKAMPRELAYTTVQTVLNILERKGKVKRTKRDRAYFYKPAVSQSEVARRAVNELVERLFGGSEENLVMSLLNARRLTPQKLDRLNKLIRTAREADRDQS